jgi:hypothetical protein
VEFLKIRSQIRSIGFSIVAVLAFVLFLRISFELIDANKQNGFVNAVYVFTDYLVAPFDKAIVLDQKSDLKPFDFDAFLALVTYVVFGLILIDIITGLFYEELRDILKNIIDAFFKLIEFVLLLRVLFEIFEVGFPGTFSPFAVKFIYDITDWSDFVDIDFIWKNLSWGPLIMLIIFAVFDIITEQLLDSLFDKSEKKT